MLGLCSEAAHLSPSAPGGRERKGLGPGLPGQGICGSSLRSSASLSLLFVYASASAVCPSVHLASRSVRLAPCSGVSAAQPSVPLPGSCARRSDLDWRSP